MSKGIGEIGRPHLSGSVPHGNRQTGTCRLPCFNLCGKRRHGDESRRESAIPSPRLGLTGREHVGLAHHGWDGQRPWDHPMDYETTQDIQQEIRKILPGYYNLGKAPKVEPNASDYFSNGYAQDVGTTVFHEWKSTKTHRPFGLRMTQLIYHSGKLSTQASGLMEISPKQEKILSRWGQKILKILGLTSGERIRLTSDQGTLEMTVAEDTSLMPGTCTVPEHFNDPPVKDLMPLQIDPITGVPYFKLAYVTIEKA